MKKPKDTETRSLSYDDATMVSQYCKQFGEYAKFRSLDNPLKSPTPKDNRVKVTVQRGVFSCIVLEGESV